MSFLLYIPLWLMVPIIALLSIAIIFTGFKIIHKFIHYEHLEKYHNVTSYIFNAFGLLYAVIIAFVVYINWSDYNNAQEQVYNESNYISNLFHNVQGFPEPVKSDLMKCIIEYTDHIYYVEMTDMKFGKSDYERNIYYSKLWDYFLKIEPKKLDNPLLYEQCLGLINKISESRRFRYFYLNNTIPSLIWVVMLFGCYFSFSFSFFFGMRAKFPYLLLVIGFTFINIILLYLIFILDHPYQGVNAISYLPMEKILAHFNTVFSGVK
ncbi:MAG: hypothetical protein WCK13_03950 [Ignavibacteriota bacterium]|nr:DUF4239 domain-containing protein [Ignavibacteriota bacterium]